VPGDYSRAVVAGVRLEDAVLADIIDQPTPLYFHHYRQANYELDRLGFQMADRLQDAGFRALDFSDLKLTMSGGMALTMAAAERWREVTGIEIVEGYGMTETSPVISVNPVNANRLGTIGVAVPSTEVRILDDAGRDLGAGEPGELVVRGPQVMQGYWQRPDETAKVMDAEGWLRTGDIALVTPEGYLRIVDRKKDMIVVSGFNVYPNEIEDVVAAHPGVLECAVVGVPDERAGEEV
jgi:long-chain acyl-CoA synthetase